jgi:Predicted outer membrane protein
MKKIKWILGSLLLAITLIPNVLQAQTYNDTFNANAIWLHGEYTVKTKPGKRIVQTMNVITRDRDGQFVYCIEPGIPLTSDAIAGYDYDQATISNMTLQQWDRVMLLSYYGYGRKTDSYDHSELKWYAVTQMMIWQTVSNGYDIYFTDVLDGNKITKYASEMEEMEKLLREHYTKPSFNNTTLNMTVGETLEIEDTNNALSKFDVTTNNNFEITKSGNKMQITAKTVSESSIDMVNRDVAYSTPPVVYVDPSIQDVVCVGYYDPITAFFNVKVQGGAVNIHKDGEELLLENGSYEYKEIILSGVKFGLYAEEDIVINGKIIFSKNQFISELITDENGNVSYGNLPFGKYYLKEIQTTSNNVLDETLHSFELKYKDEFTDVVYEDLTIKNKLAKSTLEFTKTDISDDKALPNTKICIYTEDGTEVFCGITDENGKIIINDLFVGRFYILETEAPEGYILNPEKMWFEITEDGQVIKAKMTNELKVKVPKTGLPALTITDVVSLAFLIGGVTFVVYNKKNKK